jgi:hypothetical protein
MFSLTSEMRITSKLVAVALALAVSLVLIVAARQMGGTREHFTLQDYRAMQLAKANKDAEEAYSAQEAAVFEAFLEVHSTPPTKPAMKHYVAIARRDRLDKNGLVKKMKKDLPDLEEVDV